MIKSRKFKIEDYTRVMNFLREEYLENKNENSWLCQRWEDMEYRVNVLHTQERGKVSWHDFICLWEDNEKIVAVCNSEVDKNAGCIYIMVMNICSQRCYLGLKIILP